MSGAHANRDIGGRGASGTDVKVVVLAPAARTNGQAELVACCAYEVRSGTDKRGTGSPRRCCHQWHDRDCYAVATRCEAVPNLPIVPETESNEERCAR